MRVLWPRQRWPPWWCTGDTRLRYWHGREEGKKLLLFTLASFDIILIMKKHHRLSLDSNSWKVEHVTVLYYIFHSAILKILISSKLWNIQCCGFQSGIMLQNVHQIVILNVGNGDKGYSRRTFLYLKSHDMAFFMVMSSQIAANSPSAMACLSSQQSWNSPARWSNTAFFAPPVAVWH